MSKARPLPVARTRNAGPGTPSTHGEQGRLPQEMGNSEMTSQVP